CGRSRERALNRVVDERARLRRRAAILSAAMDTHSVPESLEELQSLRTRLSEAEGKLRALERGGGAGGAGPRALGGAEAQSCVHDYQQEEFLVMLAHEFRN